MSLNLGAPRPKRGRKSSSAKKEAPPSRFERADALAFLHSIPDRSVDLVLTDPPYAISRETGFAACVGGVPRLAVSMDFGAWDKPEAFPLDKLRQTLREFHRKLRAGGTAIVFYDLWKIQDLAEAMRSAGFHQLRLIEWLKTNPVPLNASRNYLTNAREVAVLGVKGGSPTFHGRYDAGVYRFPICRDAGRFHPTQKPLALMRALVEKHSDPGAVVLDPFAGSATTLVAAAELGRVGLGCERDPRFFQKAKARLEAAAVGSGLG